jgi:hypothetical protein
MRHLCGVIIWESHIHVEVDYHFVREQVARRQLDIRFISQQMIRWQMVLLRHYPSTN